MGPDAALATNPQKMIGAHQVEDHVTNALVPEVKPMTGHLEGKAIDDFAACFTTHIVFCLEHQKIMAL